MSVTWVLNGSSKYEISSKEHLLQVMTKGSLYTDAGTPPPDYWDGDYEQTADIDLETDANITPIGDAGDKFTGTYDGGGFSISNWSMVSTINYVGLFGFANAVTLENIRLTGVWTCDGTGFIVGFLVGQAFSSIIRNIECAFEEGTTINIKPSFMGAIAGETFFSNLQGVTLRGFVNQVTSTGGSIGGILGRSRVGNHIGLRNAAVWSNGISGSLVGGIIGELQNDAHLVHAMNCMLGDITGSKCGGICGYNVRGAGTDPFNTLVNSMHGIVTGSAQSGGIVGHTHCQSGNLHLFDVTNYMTGAIVSTNGTSGGLIGLVTQESSNTCTVSNSVVAMNGSSDEAVVGSAVSTTVSTKIDTSFGFTYTTATYGSTSDAFTGTTSTLFADLDYIPLQFTDSTSHPYEYEMVFGNVGGSASYSQYTHAIISKDDIAGPYFIDFDLTGNSTEYLTYITVGDPPEAFTDASLTVLDSSANFVYNYTGSTVLFPKPPPASFDITNTGAIDVTVSIAAIAGAEAYQLRYAPTSGGAPVVSDTGFNELTKVISNLTPEVEYEISLFFLPAGLSVYTLDGSKIVTTLANVPANYNASVYGSEGKYDLSGINNLELISVAMNDIFTSGDEISIDLGRPTKTTFVKLGDTLPIPQDFALFPFTASNGVSQQVTLTLADTTTQTITYDEVSEAITVGGSTYSDGDVFVLNGKKTKVFNV